MQRYAGRGLHGQTVDAVGHRILSGDLPAGATLDLDKLADGLGISMTALREALRVLAAKGLVSSRQKRGTFVRPRADWNLLDADVLSWRAQHVDERLLDELAETRAIVEPACARMAALRHDQTDLAELASALTDMAGASCPNEAVAADLRFHDAIFRASHNELMQRFQVVMRATLAARDGLVHQSHPADGPIPIHKSVADAIKAEDPDLAHGRMIELVTNAHRDARAALNASYPKGTL